MVVRLMAERAVASCAVPQMPNAQFIQIAVATDEAGLSLYALDANGHVWEWRPTLRDWHPLSAKRWRKAREND